MVEEVLSSLQGCIKWLKGGSLPVDEFEHGTVYNTTECVMKQMAHLQILPRGSFPEMWYLQPRQQSANSRLVPGEGPC